MIRSILSGPSSALFGVIEVKVRSVAASPRRRTASDKSAGDWKSRGTDSGDRDDAAGDTEIFRRTFRTIRGGARKKHTRWP